MVFINEIGRDNTPQAACMLPVLSTKCPPCKVCCGKGSGIHYGVNTCGACKGFFGRNYKRSAHLRCRGYGNCTLHAAHKMCPACRMRKCIRVGMSHDGIKIGRSSYIQVTAAIEEVKKLELQYKLRGDGSLVSQEEHLMRVDDIINKLTDTHLTAVPNTNDFMIEVMQQEELYLEHRNLEEQVYGKRRMLARSEYQEIYQQTGLDIDGRRELLKSIGSVVDKSTQMLTGFVKHIPGFTRMSRNDQDKLTCAGVDLANGFLNMSMFNTDHGLYVSPLDTSVIVSLETMYGFDSEHKETYDLLFDLVLQCHRLELTVEEQTVAAALTFMLADAELSPIGKRIQSDSAEYLSEILYNLTQKNHSPEEHTFAKLMSVYVNIMEIMPTQQANHKLMMQDMLDLNLLENLANSPLIQSLLESAM